MSAVLKRYWNDPLLPIVFDLLCAHPDATIDTLNQLTHLPVQRIVACLQQLHVEGFVVLTKLAHEDACKARWHVDPNTLATNLEARATYMHSHLQFHGMDCCGEPISMDVGFCCSCWKEHPNLKALETMDKELGWLRAQASNLRTA